MGFYQKFCISTYVPSTVRAPCWRCAQQSTSEGLQGHSHVGSSGCNAGFADGVLVVLGSNESPTHLNVVEHVWWHPDTSKVLLASGSMEV